jgi:hypothetical protein
MMRWALAALLGVVVAAGAAYAASRLATQPIGLESEPIRAGESLAPRPRTTPKSTLTPRPTARPTATATAPVATPEVGDDDSSGHGSDGDGDSDDD